MKTIGNVQSQANAEVFAVASGALPDGKPVIVNSNGTVSVVEIGDGPPGLSSSTDFQDGAAGQAIHACYDTNANKLVIAYRRTADNHGLAIVGTVSGTSISFGTPVVFHAASTGVPVSSYDINAQKVLIGFSEDSGQERGKAIVGTVSGTGISFGSEAVFSGSNRAMAMSMAYDTNAQKHLIFYRDQGNSGYGTAVVSTISGTNVSFGSVTVFNSGTTFNTAGDYDTTAQKVILAYRNDGANTGVARVCTISGTDVSFGTAVSFNTAETKTISVAYDANANKVIIAYRTHDTGYGEAVVGTVSGTNISFGSQVTFNAASTGSEDFSIDAAYDANAQKVVIFYRDDGNSNYGAFVVGTISGTSVSFSSETVFETGTLTTVSGVYDPDSLGIITVWESGECKAALYKNVTQASNLTTENFLGFTNAAYATGQTATIQAGGAVNTGQSSLTIGQQYFVQEDGTLGLTADSPSVIAGTAVSATDLIVKG